MIRANPDGSLLRLKDVARIELGAQIYNLNGRLNGKPAAVLACYQLPGHQRARGCERREGADGARRAAVSRPTWTTRCRSTPRAPSRAGMHEIVQTLIEALVLVILVVFIFLQGWRATLIPLCAVPVSLIGTFMLFPLFGFSINTLALFGLVLAIGLVVDDAIVVVEAVEHHIEEGMSPRDATLQAMEEVSGPVIGIALVLCGGLHPDRVHSGNHRAALPAVRAHHCDLGHLLRLQRAHAQPGACRAAVAAAKASARPARLVLRRVQPRLQAHDRALREHVAARDSQGQRSAWSCSLRLRVLARAFRLAAVLRLPAGRRPGLSLRLARSLPYAASLQRTGDAARKVEQALLETPGVKHVTSVLGFNLLSTVQNTYNAFFFITLKPWDERTAPEEQYAAHQASHQPEARPAFREGIGFSFPPPAIPGIGTSGGVTFMLEDRAGRDVRRSSART